jgi:DNA-directed RNA polymerase II subunit RPB7
MTSQISVHPSKFDDQIREYIKEELFSTKKGECTEEYGYILAVNKIVSIGAGVISNTYGHIHFTVEYVVETYKPRAGDKTNGKITTILDGGFFIDSKNVRIFIPFVRLPKGSDIVNDGNDSKIRLESGKEYRKGDFTDVFIVSVRYDEQQFKCIGEI